MTQRLKGVEVAFDDDIREDDAEAILAAIRCLRHVAGVRPIETTIDDWSARMQVRSQLATALSDTIRKVLHPEGSR